MEKKKFAMTYDRVLQLGYVFHSQFVKDKAEFEAFSSGFSDPFADDFLSELKAADELPTFLDDLDEQSFLTSVLNEKLAEAAAFYSRFLKYVKLAWGDSSPKLKVFWRNEFNRKRNQPLSMAHILDSAYQTASEPEYKASLIAAGFLESDILGLMTLSDEIGAALLERDSFIDDSSGRAQERIEAFNKFWDRMTLISKTAKLIFADSPGIVRTYRLYDKRKKKKEEGD